VNRGGQAVVLVLGVAAMLVMTWQYRQQVASINSSFEHQAKAQISHVMTSIEREVEVVDMDIFGILQHLEKNNGSEGYTDLEEIVRLVHDDVDLMKRLHHLQKTASLHELIVTQRGGVDKSHSLLSDNSGIFFDVIHIQKHYEWLSQNGAEFGGDVRPEIISSTSDRKIHHIYYSKLLVKKINGGSPVMMTAMIGIEQLQRNLPDGYYLKLDGIKYSATSNQHNFSLPSTDNIVEYVESFDTIGNHKLWGKWSVGVAGVNNKFYMASFFEANRVYKIEIMVISILVLVVLIVLEYGFWSKGSLLRSNDALKEELDKRAKELVDSQENSKAISHDLLESELKLHSIINVSTDGVIICDNNGFITNINQTIKNIFGYYENDVIGKAVEFIFPEFSNQQTNGAPILDYAKENDAPLLLAVNAISKDNQFIEVELNITRVKVSGHEVWSIEVRDVSERVKNENEIRDVQASLRAVIDNIAEGVITSDEKGVILTFNPASEIIFGWNAEDIIDRNISELMTGSDRERHDEYLSRYIAFNKRKVLGEGPREVIGLKKSGDVFDMEIATSEMFSGDKRIFIAIVRDVTERKIIEKNMHMSYSELESLVDSHTENLKKVNKELIKARDEALVAARSKAEFLAMMSHEIRTPINGVLGMLSLVRDTDLNDEQHDYIESAYSSGEILHSLLNDVLDLSKIDAGRMHLDCYEFDVYQAVEKAIHVTSKTLKNSDIVISCYISKNVPRCINGDGGRLRQVLSNLISNAVKFTKKGGVSISLVVQSSSDDDVVLGFEVIDTGIGIEEEDAARIFEEFSQADNSERRNYGGSGLGLSICKRFVSMMGGEITVESDPGQGSCFSFTVSFQKCGESIPVTLFSPCKVLLLSEHNIIKNNFFTQLSDWGCELQFICSEDILSGLGDFDLSGDEVLIIELDPHGYSDFSHHVSKILNFLSTSNIKTLFVEVDGFSHRPLISDNEKNNILTLSRPVLPAELLSKINELLGNINMGDSEDSGNLLCDTNDQELAGLSILVAEDNIVNQKVITAMLKKLGVKVDIANNGEEAISALNKPDHGYKLVLMDCQMPEVDGYAATRRLRLLEKEDDSVNRIPVIAMTAHALPGDREKCLDSGMDDYITKPININVVKKTIENWL